jgi:DNA-binding GntR family transcriptional regulator
MQSSVKAPNAAAGSLHDEVLPKIRQMILEGELEPGSRIVERPLCERFKVSRTPLREAFKVLASEGLLELLPNRGARVPAFRKQDVCDAMEVIAVLEELAGELAAARATDDEIAEIRAAHYQMYAHFLRREVPEYFRLNQAIHRRIVEASGNPLLIATHEGLSVRVMRARYLMNQWDQERWGEAVAAHEKLLEALIRRNGAELGRLLREHVQKQGRRALEHFSKLEQSPAGN